jgi:cell division protein FtsW
MKNDEKAGMISADPVLWGLVLLFAGWGVVMVGSASMPLAQHTYGSAFYFLNQQCVCVILGLVLCSVMLWIPTHVWQTLAVPLLILSIGFLGLVVLVGVEVNGAKRWLALPGFRWQVSETVKWVMVLYWAACLAHVSKREQKMSRNTVQTASYPLDLLWPSLGILGVVCVLLLAEPDFGAVVVVLGTVLGMVFLAGFPMRYLFILGLGALAGLSLLAVTSPYRLLRLIAFLHPWDHPFDSGYQLTQALITYGRGGMLGLGLGLSIQKLFFLPEAHTDFIFAILAEELGFLGACILGLAYVGFLGRIFYHGMRAQQKQMFWHAYLCYGSFFYFMIQIGISIGVNLGVFPTKGLTLPFMSYGRSSLLINFLFVGLLLRVTAEISGERRLWR